MAFKEIPPLYWIWTGMRNRCRNPRAKPWKDYGGRGIRVCKRWDSYAKFAADMGPRPSPKHTLERIDNDGDYTPKNCRWATRKEQSLNLRNTRWVMIEGVEYKAWQLAERSGLKADTIIERAAQGLPLAEVLSPERRVFREGLALGGLANGARQRARTHCYRGHEFTPDNTRITPQGWRRCRQCHNEKMRRLNAAKRAEPRQLSLF